MAARDLILNNFRWKLLSVALAVLTWLTITTVQRKDQIESAQSPVVTVHSRTITNVPVTLLTTPHNTNRFLINPLTTTVEIAGTVDDLNQLQPEQITAFVDVTRTDTNGEFYQDIQVQVPPKFKVAVVKPSLASVLRLQPTK